MKERCNNLFNEIYEKYYDYIFTLCKYMLNNDVEGAKDCTQQVFLILYKKIPIMRMNADIKRWLIKTAEYEVKNYKRKNHLCVNIDDVEDIIKSNDDIQSEYEIKEQMEILTEAEKNIVKNYYLNNPEIKSKNAIAIKVSRILKKIKHYYQK